LTFLDPATIVDPQLADFIGSPEANRLRAIIKVEINGVDVTNKMMPFLIMVRVLNGQQLEDYNCEIELDDRDGKLPIPPLDSPVHISMGWQGEGYGLVFDGVTHDLEHGFGRKQGGRRMWIHAQGDSKFGLGKSPMQHNWGDGRSEDVKLEQILQEAAKNGGQSIVIHPALASIARKYWSQDNESYYAFARRLAEELGGTFRVQGGTRGQFTVPGMNVDGTPNDTVVCQWGVNLIGWRVRPLAAQPMWAKSNQQFFDIANGAWKMMQKQTNLQPPFNFGTASYQLPNPASSGGAAQQGNDGADSSVNTEQGPGRIVINGEPSAFGGCWAQLIGARPGVDGRYLARTVEHIYSRQGYITWLDVNAQQIDGQGQTGGPYSMSPNSPTLANQPPATPTTPTTPPTTPN